jgi:hypothetical protein
VQVHSGESKEQSPIQGFRERGATGNKATTAVTQGEKTKQSCPRDDSLEPRGKSDKQSATTAQVHSGESKEQSPIQGSRKIGATDNKAATAVTQGEKTKQSCPRDDSLEPRGKSGKKSATTVHVHSGESKEQSPIQGSRKTGATDEKAASAAIFGANETKKSARRESGAGGKKLISVATQVDSEKVESSPSRISAAETAVDVGVVSPTGFQSAEVFLVERLMVVLQAEKR